MLAFWPYVVTLLNVLLSLVATGDAKRGTKTEPVAFSSSVGVGLRRPVTG
jgi:hypothetical protein